MRKALYIGIVLVTATAALIASSVGTVLPATVPPETPFHQNWFGQPVVPQLFENDDPPPGERRPGLMDEPLPLPPKRWSEALAAPSQEESPFPKLMSVFDIDAWRRQDVLRQIREFGSDVTFGLPLLVPQILLEEIIPHGLAIGPTTFLYRTSKDSNSMPLVVFDQALFHQGEFLARVQAAGADAPSDSLTQIEKQVLRRSLLSGFRASYALPSISMDQILETAADQGIWGYLLIPAAGGALLFLKGIDQKFRIDDFLKARVLVTSGRQWMRSVRSSDGFPAASCELKFFDLPVSLILSMDMSSHGPASQFIGIGTSLGVVEDLLGREQTRNRHPGE